MTQQPVIIVSGLPRSGTSLMMQMLAAAGIEPLTDHTRRADEDNPEGYYELEAVKNTRADASWLDHAGGRAVKIIHALIPDLPPGRAYRVILMERDPDEVLASQARMLERSGRAGAALAPAALKRIYLAQLETARRWISAAPGAELLEVNYNRLLADPAAEAARVAGFLGRPLAAAPMAAAVRPDLYRNRAGNA